MEISYFCYCFLVRKADYDQLATQHTISYDYDGARQNKLEAASSLQYDEIVLYGCSTYTHTTHTYFVIIYSYTKSLLAPHYVGGWSTRK